MLIINFDKISCKSEDFSISHRSLQFLCGVAFSINSKKPFVLSLSQRLQPKTFDFLMFKHKSLFLFFLLFIEMISIIGRKKIFNQLPSSVLICEVLHIDGLIFKFKKRSPAIFVGNVGHEMEGCVEKG